MAYSVNTTTYQSPNYNNRPTGMKIDSLVIHTTEGYWASDAQWMCNPDSGVSTHYVIPPTGTIVYQLVPPSKRAWHAGESHYQGRSNFNDFSLGLEISHVKGQVYPKGQQDLFAALARALIDAYHIPQANVVAHRWIAPDRRSDPSDWPDDKLNKWIASLYAPQFVYYAVQSPCAVFTARNPSSPLAGGPNDGQTWLNVGDVITVGLEGSIDGWLWISPNTTDPPGLGFIPASYARPA